MLDLKETPCTSPLILTLTAVAVELTLARLKGFEPLLKSSTTLQVLKPAKRINKELS